MKKLKLFIHHFFVPSEGNSFRARALHIDMLTTYLIAAILLGFIYRSAPQLQIGQMILGVATDISAQQLLNCTNKNRAQTGLVPLTYSQKLETAAYSKAQDMFKYDYWSHYGPKGETPWQFILSSGYKYTFAGENLARDFLFSNDVCDAWMASPTHRENMLRDVYNDVGFAVVDGLLQGEKTTLVVQMFGRKDQSTNQIANASAPPTHIDNKPLPPVNPIAQVKTKPFSSKSNLTGMNTLKFELSIAFMFVLSLALITDLYYAKRLGLLRLSGKHMAHLFFIAAALTALLILSKGTISTQAALF